MIGGGFGAKGGVEITHQNDETRRKISIRTARSLALTINEITLYVFALGWLLWWGILILTYTAPTDAAWYAKAWGGFVYVASDWFPAMGRTWWAYAFVLVMGRITPMWILAKKNLYPKLLNDHWPPEGSQMDSNKSGFVTAENWDARAGVAPIAVAQPATLITIDLADSTTHRYLTDIALVPELQQFAQGVLAGIVSFSERGATGCHWDKAAFQDLRDQMIERTMITWKNGHNKQSGYNIGPVARRALGELARPLPHSPG